MTFVGGEPDAILAGVMVTSYPLGRVGLDEYESVTAFWKFVTAAGATAKLKVAVPL